MGEVDPVAEPHVPAGQTPKDMQRPANRIRWSRPTTRPGTRRGTPGRQTSPQRTFPKFQLGRGYRTGTSTLSPLPSSPGCRRRGRLGPETSTGWRYPTFREGTNKGKPHSPMSHASCSPRCLQGTRWCNHFLSAPMTATSLRGKRCMTVRCRNTPLYTHTACLLWLRPRTFQE